MSDPQPPLNETPARREALQDVLFGLISYNPILGQYLKGGVPVPGPKRRTLSEDLRGNGYIQPGSRIKTAKMLLTESGTQLAKDWGLASQTSSGETTEASGTAE